MPAMSERRVDAVTLAEAALILGCSRATVRRLIANEELPPADRSRHRQLARADVEALALRTYRWRMHRHDAEPYWLTGRRAAETLGVNGSRLRQLAADDRIPYVRHVDGTLMFRREQLAVVATARDIRWHGGTAAKS